MTGPAPRKTSSTLTLEEAIKAREKFLKEHPELQPFQDEIDRIMAKTVGFENRMSVLAFMIQTKLFQLRDSITELRAVTLKAQGVVGKTKVQKADKILDYSTNTGGYLN